MEGYYEYSNWVIIGLGIFMIAMLAIGWFVSSRVEGIDDYVVAGRKLGLFVGTGTLFATWYGVSAPIGYSGNAYVYGNQGLIFDPWGAIFLLILLGLFFARKIRRSKYLTVVDFLASRYGKSVGVCATFFLALSDTGWLASMLVASGSLIEFFTHLPLAIGMGISTAILIVYTYLGGMWAVAVTDAVQMVILTIGMIILLVAVFPMSGGWEVILSNDPANNLMHYQQWSFFPTPESAADPEYNNAGFLGYKGYLGWFYWLAAWMSVSLGSLPTQSLVQRISAVKDEKTGTSISFLACLLFLIVGLIPVALGTIYFQINPNLTLEEAFTRIPLLMAVEYLSPILAVVFVAALVAALMSSADSAILAVATLVGYNAYRSIKPEASERELFRATHYAVPITGILALVIALYFNAVYKLMVLAAIVILVSISVPFIAAFFWKKANGFGAISAAIGGFSSWIIAFFLYLPTTKAVNTRLIAGVQEIDFESARWDAFYIASVWGVLVSILALVVVSLATQKLNKPRPLVDADGNFMSVGLPGFRWGKVFSSQADN